MLLESIVATSAAAVAYHHVGYPWLLRKLAQRTPSAPHAEELPGELPSVTVVVPAYNEARVIADKMKNLAALEYPADKLRIVIACDGCTDETAALVRAYIAEHGHLDHFHVLDAPTNVGKVAVLNAQIADAKSEIIALTDASAMLPKDALLLAAKHFLDPEVGLVCPTYRLETAGSVGEQTYWDYQTRLKVMEAAVGAPMGAHGAFYLFRRDCWTPLPADTINDDFMLPMSIIMSGKRAVYDANICSIEREKTEPDQEFCRRLRIGAGNLQQLFRVMKAAHRLSAGTLFVFLSGKGLRVAIPFLMVLAGLAITVGAMQGQRIFMALAALGVSGALAAAYAITHRQAKLPKALACLGYIAEGYTASFLGALRYMVGLERKPWARAAVTAPQPITLDNMDYIPPSVAWSKRALDIALGMCALAALVVLFVPIALAIKLTSPGPIFYRQLRVGRATRTATHLFYLTKFRTMRADAEQASGAVWASKNDPRITRVGNFLRKTRLDELPQCINVLKGEMSVVGPRPERPSFFNRLEDAIPFYSERTYGLLPGITGLAQVNQAYDQSIEDVRNKVLYDHAYAAQLSGWRHWVRADIGIIFKTFTVMALGKGQ